MANTVIKSEIDRNTEKRRKNTDITAARVLDELAALAFHNVKDYAHWYGRTVTLKSSEEIPDELTRCISEIQQVYDSRGEPSGIKVKFHSKTKALNMLGQHLKLFTQNLDIGGEALNTIAAIAQQAANARRSK